MQEKIDYYSKLNFTSYNRGNPYAELRFTNGFLIKVYQFTYGMDVVVYRVRTGSTYRETMVIYTVNFWVNPDKFNKVANFVAFCKSTISMSYMDWIVGKLCESIHRSVDNRVSG